MNDVLPDTQKEDKSSQLERVQQALRREDREAVEALIDAAHPADIADMLESLAMEQRLLFWEQVPHAIKGEVLWETHDEVREYLIDHTSTHELATALVSLETDELADLYEQLSPPVIDALLQRLDDEQRRRLEAVSAYPPDSAGGLMDIDAVAVRDDVTLDVVLRYLRRLRSRQGELPEHLDAVTVVDEDNIYQGVVLLSDLVSLGQGLTVAEIMQRDVPAVDATTPVGRVARLFEDRDLISMAVIDEQQRLLGRITIDDVVDVIREQGERHLMGRAGMTEEADMFAPVFRSARHRAVWLGVHLVNAFIGAWVISRFGASIEQMVALAILMPVVASMGGVAGNQTLTLVTRGIALEQIARSNAGLLLAKEVAVALVNGVIWAVVVALIATAWFDNLGLGLVFAVALLINFLNAAILGSVLPLLLRRLGIDPALAGGVILTAVTDVVGFFVFLGLAALLLM
ncbi:MAG: magnesium transporter [Thiohalophilus sp.]|uniref:magnesium transporter n=1 Tax=Thiohalophilus sp. TaxID=3028392 RepID=UPI00287099F4|nr:magnesium transporter [Thiohalophilus sp.]MDR9435365.1 magnesium transporter [Thiohalophilus sp.]